GQHTGLWRAAALERPVDRTALLSAEEPPEPPYWAHLWSGALVLAAAVPEDPGSVVELGCGLGLPGLVAARRGARVTFVDRAPAALAFVRASAALNRVAAGGPRAAGWWGGTARRQRWRLAWISSSRQSPSTTAAPSLASQVRSRACSPGGAARFSPTLVGSTRATSTRRSMPPPSSGTRPTTSCAK